MIVEIADRLKHVEEYYFSRKLAEIAAREKAGTSIINLGIGKPDMAPAAPIINTLHEESLDPTAHGYQPYKGVMQFREAISEYYKTYFTVDCDARTEVLPLIGSKEGIMHISMAFLNKDDEVLVPNPGYPSYASAAHLAGAKPVYYELHDSNSYQVEINTLNELVTARTKIIWINYPHMPTGAIAERANLEELVRWASEKKILIASDAPYSFILNKDRYSILSIPGAKEVCVELNSLSKSHSMSGWRVGMAISSPEIIEAILRFKSNMDSGMFLPIKEAAITAMKINPIWYDSNDRIYEERRAAIWQLLDRIDFTYNRHTAGLFVWSKVSDKFDSGEEASDFLLDKARVFAPPGMIFGSMGHKYVRWSLCQPLEVIREASRAIISVMNY